MSEEYAYKRVLLKLSGEALAGSQGYGIDPKVVDDLAEELVDVVDGVELCIVVGGGNIFRGMAGAAEGMDRSQADYIGMLATVMNSLALQEAFERHGIETRVQSAISMQEVCESAALRACELDCELLMKATKVDGVYDKDPVKNPDAKKFDRISYKEVLARDLHVMDAAATSLCMDNSLPIMVFNLDGKGNIAAALRGESVGTVVE